MFFLRIFFLENWSVTPSPTPFYREKKNNSVWPSPLSMCHLCSCSSRLKSFEQRPSLHYNPCIPNQKFLFFIRTFFQEYRTSNHWSWFVCVCFDWTFLWRSLYSRCTFKCVLFPPNLYWYLTGSVDSKSNLSFFNICMHTFHSSKTLHELRKLPLSQITVSRIHMSLIFSLSLLPLWFLLLFLSIISPILLVSPFLSVP